MSSFSIQNVSIKGISAAVPKCIESNLALENYNQLELQKLIDTIGITERRIATKNQCASDLCIAAAEKLITDLNWKRDDIELLIFVTQTPDYILPGSSSIIQHKLGLNEKCMCLDLNQGCAGYVYGLSVISAMMSAAKLKSALLLVGDTITKSISKSDNSLRPLFSDAGTATLLNLNENATTSYFNTYSEGKNFDSIIIPNGGYRNKYSILDEEQLNVDSNNYLTMKGLDVFNFTLKKVIPNIEQLLEVFEINKDEIDNYIFHQANLLILKSLSKKLDINFGNLPTSLNDFGNTSSASIPLTLLTAMSENNLITNKKLLLCGFGVGLSIGSTLIEFKEVYCPNIIELE